MGARGVGVGLGPLGVGVSVTVGGGGVGVSVGAAAGKLAVGVAVEVFVGGIAGAGVTSEGVTEVVPGGRVDGVLLSGNGSVDGVSVNDAVPESGSVGAGRVEDVPLESDPVDVSDTVGVRVRAESLINVSVWTRLGRDAPG